MFSLVLFQHHHHHHSRKTKTKIKIKKESKRARNHPHHYHSHRRGRITASEKTETVVVEEKMRCRCSCSWCCCFRSNQNTDETLGDASSQNHHRFFFFFFFFPFLKRRRVRRKKRDDGSSRFRSSPSRSFCLFLKCSHRDVIHRYRYEMLEVRRAESLRCSRPVPLVISSLPLPAWPFVFVRLRSVRVALPLTWRPGLTVGGLGAPHSSGTGGASGPRRGQGSPSSPLGPRVLRSAGG